MKRFIVLTFLACLLVVSSGCLEGESLVDLTKAVNANIDAQQESSARVIVAIMDSQLVDEKKLDSLESKVKEGFGVVDDLQEVALETAKTYDENLVKGIVVATLEAAQVVNKASAPINPYYGIIGTILASLVALKKSKDSLDNKTALKEVVVGVEDFREPAKANGSMGARVELDISLAKATSNKTKNLISTLKN